MFEAKLTIEIPGLEALAAAIAHRARTVGASADVLAQRRVEYGVSSAPAPSLGPAPALMTPPPISVPGPAPTAGYAPSPVPTAGHTPGPASAPAAPPPAPSYTPGPAPTTPPPSYSHEQVGKAGAALIASNPIKREELLSLLPQFGVQAIQELKPEQLGPFATALRGLGAKI